MMMTTAAAAAESASFDLLDARMGRLPWRDEPLRSQVAQVAVNDTVVVTIANAGFCEFAANFLESLRLVHVTNVIVFMLGQPQQPRFVECVALLRQHVPGDQHIFIDTTTTMLDGGLSPEISGFKKNQYNLTVNLKMLCVLRVVKLGYHAVVSDADTVWRRNFFDVVATLNPNADVLLTCDISSVQMRDYMLVHCPHNYTLRFPYRRCKTCREWTGALYLVRATAGGIHWITDLLHHANETGLYEQLALNDLLKTKGSAHFRDVVFGHISEKYVVSGRLLLAQENLTDVFVAHANWVPDHRAKRQLLIDNHLYFLPISTPHSGAKRLAT